MSDAPQFSKEQKPKRLFWKKKRVLIPGVLLILIIVGTAAGSGGGSSDSSDSSSSDQATSKDAAAKKDSPTSTTAPAFPGAKKGDKVLQAGETADVNGVQISAATLKAGDSTLEKTLCSAVSYVNNSSKSASFNGGFDWKVQDPNGVILSNTFSGSDNVLKSGELAPGGKLNADVCFSAPADGSTGQFVVLLDPTFRFSSDRVAWLSKL